MTRTTTLLATCLLIGTLAGCLGGPSDDEGANAAQQAAQRVDPETWRGQLTADVYEGITSTFYYIEAKDGIQLSLSLHLPSNAPANATLPTLVELTPYQGLSEDHPARQSSLSSSWAQYVNRGAAVVRADARGTNGSEGCLDFGGQKDRDDAEVFVDWILAQPWSNGVVVFDGVSHPGMGSVVAHTASADIAGVLAVAPVVSYYQDEWLQGAKFEDQLNGVGYQQVELEPALHDNPNAVTSQIAPCTGETFIDYDQVDGPFTELWQDRDLSLHVDTAIAANKPILLEHGFVDLNVHPDHTQKYWDALPDDFPKYLVMGWWYHQRPDFAGHPYATPGDPTEQGYNADQDYRHRFMDATLFGKDNGYWSEPRVLVEDSTHVWHESENWPLDGSQTVTWFPAENGALRGVTADDGAASYPDVAGAPTRGHWTGTHVAFRSDPLDNATLVNGAPEVHLVASSTATQTKWVAYLLDEAPDGSWQRITHGYADSHSYGEPEQWLDMEPGKEYTWDLKLMPTAVVVEEGHRITLLITSQDSRRNPTNEPHCWDDHRREAASGCYNPSGIVPSASVGQATNTIHLGAEGTYVNLAIVDPTTTQKVPWPVAK